MPTKVLLCKSTHAEKKEPRGRWHKFDEAQPYIKGMETGKIAETVTAEVFNSMVSGVPTPWARARLFGFAFPYTQTDANIKTAGLIEFYKELIKEWKGLVACIACFPKQISVSKPIYMDYGNSKNSKGLRDYFYFPNAIGRMLFDDKDLWCDPKRLPIKSEERPFIQLIYYKNILIGGISPYSIIFTASEYQELNTVIDPRELTWFRNGKFIDPLGSGMTQNQQQSLYLLVKNFSKVIPFFEADINKNRNGKKQLSFLVFKEFLEKWEKEIFLKSENTLIDVGNLDEPLDFVYPYKKFFNIDQSIFVDNLGKFTLVEEKRVSDIDPQTLLLQEDKIIEIKDINKWQPLNESVIHYLEIQDPSDSKKNRYFALPFSAIGLKVFKTEIANIIEIKNTGNNHRLKSKVSGNQLLVELILKVDDNDFPPIKKSYEILPLSTTQNIIIWPNFVSKEWNSYYLYSEFPHNETSDYQMIPFFKDVPNNDFIVDEHGKFLYQDTKLKDVKYSKEYENEHLEVNNLISYPIGKISSKHHRYEILKSNKAFAGIEIRKHILGKNYVYGYLILKNDGVKDYSHTHTHLTDVTVGIDFGSNNSCVNYRTDENSYPVKFENRRVFLVGTETRLENTDKELAEKHELFFFQNEKTEKGQIKSWIHEHDKQYIVKGNKEVELAGGLPTFKTNIHINDMTDKTITTNAGYLHHSMKWLTDIDGVNKKTAYLKTVWLHVFADLYAKSLYPKELRWAYPGAFARQEIFALKSIFEQIRHIKPIKNKTVNIASNPITESEAVSNYAMLQFGNDNAILLGIDVGGSTSDVLIIGRTKKTRQLLKQSSVRLAAGYLTDGILRSQKFRNVLLDFYYNANSPIKNQIPNIEEMTKNPQTAPFFLNIIFDKLQKDLDFEDFYSHIFKLSPRILALPAYITGLLLFYSGQLIAKAVEEHQLDIREINLLSFGKGGRIFDWLETNEEEIEDDFYEEDEDDDDDYKSEDVEDEEDDEDMDEDNEDMDEDEEDEEDEDDENEEDEEEYEEVTSKKTKMSLTQKYFADCIRAGFGNPIFLKNKKSVNPDKFFINKAKEIRKDNKSEVAMGLTSPRYVSVSNDLRKDNSDIFGEKGFKYTFNSKKRKKEVTIKIKEDKSVDKKYFAKDLGKLTFPKTFKNLNKFLEIYLTYVRERGILVDTDILDTKIIKVKKEITNYILSDKEFIKARENKKSFDFKHSMLILEGMCYMEKFLIPEVYNE